MGWKQLFSLMRWLMWEKFTKAEKGATRCFAFMYSQNVKRTGPDTQRCSRRRWEWHLHLRDPLRAQREILPISERRWFTYAEPNGHIFTSGHMTSRCSDWLRNDVQRIVCEIRVSVFLKEDPRTTTYAKYCCLKELWDSIISLLL